MIITTHKRDKSDVKAKKPGIQLFDDIRIISREEKKKRDKELLCLMNRMLIRAQSYTRRTNGCQHYERSHLKIKFKKLCLSEFFVKVFFNGLIQYRSVEIIIQTKFQVDANEIRTEIFSN